MRKVDLVREDDGRVVMPGENLRGADLREAVLEEAALEGADLGGANLSRSPKRSAILEGANLRGANLRWANLEDAIGIDEVPRSPVPGLAARVLEQITGHPQLLYMAEWHSDCGTKHCFAGWAVTLAGEVGKAAEGRLGTASAARLLLGGSDHPFGEEDGDEVIPWLEARVAEEESNAKS